MIHDISWLPYTSQPYLYPPTIPIFWKIFRFPPKSPLLLAQSPENHHVNRKPLFLSRIWHVHPLNFPLLCWLRSSVQGNVSLDVSLVGWIPNFLAKSPHFFRWNSKFLSSGGEWCDIYIYIVFTYILYICVCVYIYIYGGFLNHRGTPSHQSIYKFRGFLEFKATPSSHPNFCLEFPTSKPPSDISGYLDWTRHLGPGAVGALPAGCSCRYHVAYLDEGRVMLGAISVPSYLHPFTHPAKLTGFDPPICIYIYIHIHPSKIWTIIIAIVIITLTIILTIMIINK